MDQPMFKRICVPIGILAVFFLIFATTALGQGGKEQHADSGAVVESQRTNGKKAPAIITETQPSAPVSGVQTASPAGTGDKAKNEKSGNVEDNAGAGENQPRGWNLLGRMVAALVLIVLVIGSFMFYLYVLQQKFLTVCKDEKQMATFFNSPAGLPQGTIRAIIALIIITVSLSLIVLNGFGFGGKFPEVLAGLLGTVLGFYFGSKTSAGDEVAQEQLKEYKAQRDDAVTKNETIQSDTLTGKIKKGLSMSRTALELLPEAEKKKYGEYISKLEAGLNTVESIAGSGNLKDAAAKAGEIYDLFKKENPAMGAFNKALQAFGSVLGGNTALATAVASTVVVLCTKLSGTIYQKWKARVLHGPFSPAVIPIKAIDANTGFTLLIGSPIFKKAFTPELEGNDRPFMTAITDIVGRTDVEDFWNKYRDRFESREQFEAGLEEFRRNAVDLELQADLPSAPLAEAGGYRSFVDAVDKIESDPDAKASLDELFVMTENLHKNGEPVLTILDKVKSEVKP